LIVAKISFAIYFLTGLAHIRDPATLYIAWPGCIAIIASYSLANWRWERDCYTWVLFHMAFHFFVALEKYIVLTGSFA
jgi:hypothetical protein